MKILFAVSNENVSKRIAESYRQKYQEDVSSKNVFYFNAIIREIKNDKTYDRIVISEDLEPFSNSNYDVIDRFILERLKEISYEASALEKRPDIIVICTDRRTKSGYVLSKMHEYGIYNALVGTDRKIDAVCDLLNRPRASQEAKEYYKIEGTQTDTSSVDDVTEQEVQNILIHYKRLGKNEDRYTDSFNNIAAQYTDKQLKIIIKCLPINVRAVLEAECPKYQELVTYADESEEEKAAKAKIQEQRRMEQIENDRKLKQKIEKEKKEALRKAQKESNQPIQQQAPQVQTQLRSGIDLLDNKNAQPRMTGNVIIPNNMNIKNERKIYSDEELQAINNTPRERRMENIAQPTQQMEQESVQNNQHNSTKPLMSNEVAQTNQNIQQEATLPGLEDVTFPETNISGAENNSLPGLEDWDADPFAENVQQTNQNIQQEATLPGLEDVTFPETNISGAENNSLPGLEDWDADPFAENVQQSNQNIQQEATLPGLEDVTFPETNISGAESNSLPGLEDWDADPFAENVQQANQNIQQEATLPGLEDVTFPETNISGAKSNSLPGLEDWDADPFAENVQQTNQNIQQEATLPGLEDVTFPETNISGAESNSLPELENWDEDSVIENNVQQANQNIQQEATLPGLEDITFPESNVPEIENTKIKEINNNVDLQPESLETSYENIENNMNTATEPIVEKMTEDQLQMPDVTSIPEVPQPPKRGRGRPRKYPIEPPKPKGKRGRPRKNPLPEEAQIEKEEQTITSQTSEKLPVQAQSTQLTEVEEPKAPIPTMVPNNQNVILENETINQQDYQKTILQNEMPNQSYNGYSQNIQQEATLPGMEDWNIDPFAESTVQTTQSMQQETTLPGVEDWNTDPFAESTVQTTQSMQQETTLPGVEDWNTDPFAESTVQTTQNIQQETTLPGVNDWNSDPFAESTVQTNQNMQQETTLSGVNDWDSDPFAESTVQTTQNMQQETTLPGVNDWDADPFAESTVQTTQNMQQETTLPGVNDWDADPFAENDNSLPGIDNSVGYELENNSDTLSSSVVNPYNTNTTTNYQQNYDYNQASTGYGTNNNYNQVDNYNQADNGYNPNSTLNQYDNQTNNGYEQNNSYNQQNTGYNQSSIGFAQQDNYNEQVSSYSPSQERKESLQKIEENRLYSTGSLNSILTKDKKIVAFVGASKSGTSFLVNNLACLFSSIGVKTAILDMTSNKNSYFIYTNNDENLRNIAYSSIENLENGIAEGIRVDRNLNVYTSIPNDGKDYSNAEAILSTLVQNESLILIDCDFTTDLGYLANAQEIYLVQSMDILTIQPLTAFLRDLKTKGILEQEKLRVVINKEVKVKGLSSKAVIGGMSFYNDPAMSYMTELFNKEKIRACSIPFDEGVYSKYLESIVNCVITISGYNKSFMNSLKILGNMVYPLLSKQTYNTKSSAEANYGNNFSAEMNNTLNQMKNKY
ncbi:MAG: hypothetical protein J6K45_05225 [Clostridia bacterium]|nr:hypothetical protein [Clostridia bacterium]